MVLYHIGIKNETMKISLDDKFGMIIKELYNEATLITNNNEKLIICMRDSGFEFTYNNIHYEAKNGVVKPLNEKDANKS